MVFEPDKIVEKALNKSAKFALSTQLDEAEDLEVKIKTDPGKLARGELDSFVVEGEGLVMQEDLKMERLEIATDSIAVNPLKALTGKLELSKPTAGKARIVLNETDVNHAFTSEIFQSKMQDFDVNIEGEEIIVDTQEVSCHFLRGDRVKINAKIILKPQGEIRKFAFSTAMKITEDRRGVLLENVRYEEGTEISPKLTTALIDEAREILHLSNFEMEGISLLLESLEVAEGKLTLQATAKITRLP